MSEAATDERFPASGIAKGMVTTFRNFFAPKVTRQYPEERPQIPDRWRGRLDLIYDPFGEHKCEVCFQCAQVCPVEAIDMSGFDSQGNRIRYGMPEIYDERKDANAYRRAGQPARPMRNPARWDEEVDTPWVDETIDALRRHGRRRWWRSSAPIEERYGYLPERALRRVSDRMSIHWAQVFGAAGLGGFRLLPADRPRRHGLRLRRLPLRGRAGAARGDRGGARDPRRRGDARRRLQAASSRTDVGAGSIEPAIRVDTLVYGPVDAATRPPHRRRAPGRRLRAAARAEATVS